MDYEPDADEVSVRFGDEDEEFIGAACGPAHLELLDYDPELVPLAGKIYGEEAVVVYPSSIDLDSNLKDEVEESLSEAGVEDVEYREDDSEDNIAAREIFQNLHGGEVDLGKRASIHLNANPDHGPDSMQ